MTKKISIVISDAYSYAGTENVCNFMTDTLGDDYEITLISLTGGGKTFYPFNKVKRIITLESQSLKTLKAIKLARHYGSDAIFVVSMGKLSVFYALFSLLTLRGLKRTVACEHVSINSFKKSVKFLKFIFLRLYRQVVVLTDKDLNLFLKKNVNSVKISNPVFEKKFNRAKRTKVALSIGRLDPQKGFDRLITIWSFFIKENPDWKLKIAGEGEMKNLLSKMINDYSLSSSVELLGRIDQVDILYQEADIYLMTSRYEGLPMVLLEAKSWSLPTIAYDCETGPREIINDNIDGFLVEDGNSEKFLMALNKLVSDDSLYTEMVRSCEMTISKFSAHNIRNEWKKLVQTISK